MRRETVTLSDYRDRIGQEVGLSDWILVDQPMIDAFAEATLDDQFIHTDPERARSSPFGSTIAHGFLTLSLLSRLCFDALPQVVGTGMSLNYGMNSLRFLFPVGSGKRVRARFTLADMANKDTNRILTTYDVAVEIEGVAKPALVAQWLIMLELERPT